MGNSKQPQYHPLTVANTFISTFAGEYGIDHLKVHKLCYLAYGWWLTEYKDPLFKEKPEVWKKGPIFSTLFDALKEFRGDLIRTPQAITPFSRPKFVTDQKVLRFLEWIWDTYSSYTGVELSKMTSKDGTPWKQIVVENDFFVYEKQPIDEERIRRFFLKEKAKRIPGYKEVYYDYGN